MVVLFEENSIHLLFELLVLFEENSIHLLFELLVVLFEENSIHLLFEFQMQEDPLGTPPSLLARKQKHACRRKQCYAFLPKGLFNRKRKHACRRKQCYAFLPKELCLQTTGTTSTTESQRKSEKVRESERPSCAFVCQRKLEKVKDHHAQSRVRES